LSTSTIYLLNTYRCRAGSPCNLYLTHRSRAVILQHLTIGKQP